MVYVQEVSPSGAFKNHRRYRWGGKIAKADIDRLPRCAQKADGKASTSIIFATARKYKMAYSW